MSHSGVIWMRNSPFLIYRRFHIFGFKIAQSACGLGSREFSCDGDVRRESHNPYAHGHVDDPVLVIFADNKSHALVLPQG